MFPFPDARYLNDFDVFITSTNSSDPKDGRMCASYQNSSTTSPASIIVLVCINQPTRGRYLVVRRQPTASFRPDAIAIAEIRVFTKFSDNQAVVGPKNQATTSRVIQSGTWQNLGAELAVDGNSSTWSTTDTSIDPTWAGQLAWWQMDLGAVRNVTEVTITSSTDYTNSRYLKDFSIDLLMNSRMNSIWTSGATQCYYFRGDVEMGATVTYKCYNPTPGRYLLIRRVDTNAYRPDALSLAEVQYKYV
ncbi:hypothetical protein HELRODRAFT_167350 [Helobdella robusta]|uniref:F5/8 type C domain-containing protein n=1 Tax=Helobdella robusta TaxID=6412 RepID=T1EZA5_HELRO|nr:hypothetical protein HELRODRAFT_167350 [Helobdella robusta]ESO10847.1 hypothetical protein HELRODRAFT_167350 [Helobdella robusta]